MALHKINTVAIGIILVVLIFIGASSLFSDKKSNAHLVPPVQTEVSPTYGDSTFSMFELDGGTFNMTIDILVGSDKAKAIQYVNYQFDTKYTVDILNGIGGMTFTNEGGYLIIWVANLNKTPEDIGYIEHELLHAVVYIMNYSGVTLSEESEETFTYELSYLTRQLYKHVK